MLPGTVSRVVLQGGSPARETAGRGGQQQQQRQQEGGGRHHGGRVVSQVVMQEGGLQDVLGHGVLDQVNMASLTVSPGDKFSNYKTCY